VCGTTFVQALAHCGERAQNKKPSRHVGVESESARDRCGSASRQPTRHCERQVSAALLIFNSSGTTVPLWPTPESQDTLCAHVRGEAPRQVTKPSGRSLLVIRKKSGNREMLQIARALGVQREMLGRTQSEDEYQITANL